MGAFNKEKPGKTKIKEMNSQFTLDNVKMIYQGEDCIQPGWPEFQDPLHPISIDKQPLIT